MGNLLKERLTQAFFHSGIDFANQSYTYQRKKVQMSNGYISIFICLTSHAIHLELVSSMCTDAFIASL